MNDINTQARIVLLLDQLKEERDKYTRSDKAVMQRLCDELETLGVYKPNNYGYTSLQMVEGWGVDWHEYRGKLECPHCKADLRDQRGPPFKREIGIYDRGLDRTMCFICPDCKERI